MTDSADAWKVTDADVWNGICEDAECEDSNFHATVDELMDRIASTSRIINVMDDVENIIEAAWVAHRKGQES